MASGSGSYGDDLGGRFADQYGDWRGNNRSPQTKEEYDAHLTDSQTHKCSRLAARYYIETNGVVLRNQKPEDSQAFACSWTAPGDNRRCYHVTFRARVGTDDKEKTFFAEILGNGNGPPEQVQNCVMLDGPSSWSTNICESCSGLWHPRKSGSFGFGRK